MRLLTESEEERLPVERFAHCHSAGAGAIFVQTRAACTSRSASFSNEMTSTEKKQNDPYRPGNLMAYRRDFLP